MINSMTIITAKAARFLLSSSIHLYVDDNRVARDERTTFPNVLALDEITKYL